MMATRATNGHSHAADRPPMTEGVEELVLSAIFAEPHRIADYQRLGLRPDTFQSIRCRFVYASALKVWQEGGQPELTTVWEEISRRPGAADEIGIGGLQWLVSLCNGVTPAMPEVHVRQMTKAHERRRIKAAALDIAQFAD